MPEVIIGQRVIHTASAVLLFLVLAGMTNSIGPVRLWPLYLHFILFRGICGLGSGAKGCSQRIFLDSYNRDLLALCKTSDHFAVFTRARFLHAGTHVKADGGDTAVCIAATRLLAPWAVNRSGYSFRQVGQEGSDTWQTSDLAARIGENSFARHGCCILYCHCLCTTEHQ